MELFEAVVAGNVHQVRRFLSQGGSPNTIDPKDGRTPLFAAVSADKAHVARLLLQSGADPNQWIRFVSKVTHRVARGARALMVVRSVPVARLLIQAGADVDSEDSHGRTPLNAAVLSGNAALLTLLLKAGANPVARNRRGLTAADVALERLNWLKPLGRRKEVLVRRGELRAMIDILEGWRTQA